jgi:hypothetical protein
MSSDLLLVGLNNKPHQHERADQSEQHHAQAGFSRNVFL